MSDTARLLRDRSPFSWHIAVAFVLLGVLMPPAVAVSRAQDRREASTASSSAPIFYVTDRELREGAGTAFGDSRAEDGTLRYGRAVARSHARKSGGSAVTALLDRAAFYDQLGEAANRDLAAGGSGTLLVYVHGYNKTSVEAIAQADEFMANSATRGTLVVFDWASAGRTVNYFKDAERAEATEGELEAFLRELLAQPWAAFAEGKGARAGGSRLNVIAHSMGSRPVLGVLLALSERPVNGAKLGVVGLAAADVDAEVASNALKTLDAHRPCEAIVAFVSPTDYVLVLSRRVAGAPRLGLSTLDESLYRVLAAHRERRGRALATLRAVRELDPGDGQLVLAQYARNVRDEVTKTPERAYDLPWIRVYDYRAEQAGHGYWRDDRRIARLVGAIVNRGPSEPEGSWVFWK